MKKIDIRSTVLITGLLIFTTSYAISMSVNPDTNLFGPMKQMTREEGEILELNLSEYKDFVYVDVEGEYIKLYNTGRYNRMGQYIYREKK